MRRIISFGSEDNGEGNPSVIIEGENGENNSAINLIGFPDNEKLLCFEGFCFKCQNPTMHVFSSKNRRFICTGCGKRVQSYKLTERLWDKIANRVGSKPIAK